MEPFPTPSFSQMISPPNEDCNTFGLTLNPLDFLDNCGDDFFDRARDEVVRYKIGCGSSLLAFERIEMKTPSRRYLSESYQKKSTNTITMESMNSLEKALDLK